MKKALTKRYTLPRKTGVIMKQEEYIFKGASYTVKRKESRLTSRNR